ncbi:hypothetical protein [Roseivirga sp.]|uniref:hypothetical protein n=1 Tax=Roseivirga sp. TaxID=1964215 RepID=UPI003B51F739
MQKILFLLAILGAVGIEGLAQTKKHFTVKGNESCEKIYFSLKASSGTCEIRTRMGELPINIMGYHNEEYITSDFGEQMEGKTLHAWLNLKDNGKEGFGSKLTKIFGKKTTDTENYWNIYFTDYRPYTLDLNYGVGKAYIDLSDIAVENCRITSGNAHVKVGYLSKVQNRTEMDTMIVSVDLGDVEIERIDLARAKNILAEVGFGNLTLDFDEQPSMSSSIWARVGAGNLTINLPKNNVPVLVRMKDTSYRKFKVPEGFEKVSDNVFVSSSYTNEAENMLIFNIDLSMGSVIFNTN